jgi:hypothetical protein
LKRNDARNRDATNTQKDTQQMGEKLGCFVARFGANFQPPPDPLNPTNDPELSRLLALPPGERLVAPAQAGCRCEFDAGRLVRMLKLADIEGEPEALDENPRQEADQGTGYMVDALLGDADAGRVCCGDCAHFERDRIGDGSGIGKCAVLADPPGGLLYPRIERRCGKFAAITVAVETVDPTAERLMVLHGGIARTLATMQGIPDVDGEFMRITDTSEAKP